jgi:CheY-like chemotaxis protein
MVKAVTRRGRAASISLHRQMASPNSQPPRIVVIEDNPADVMLLRHALDEAKESYDLEVFSDGAAALRFVSEQAGSDKEDPCLIILDLHLPRYEGTVILEAIRRHPQLTRLKLAVLTTLASPAQEEKVKALGVHLYRRKPSEWEDFQRLGEELMALCKQPGERVARTA